MHKIVKSYSGVSKFFHWIIALIVILMLSGSFFLGSLPAPLKSQAFMFHKSFGITVLILMVLRLLWLAYAGKPPLPVTVPLWQKFFAHLVQYSLYFFLLLMPICGWLMSVAANKPPVFFGMFSLSLPWITPSKALAEFFELCHNTIAWILIALIILHICGAIKEHFIDKDGVLLRMLPERK